MQTRFCTLLVSWHKPAQLQTVPLCLCTCTEKVHFQLDQKYTETLMLYSIQALSKKIRLLCLHTGRWDTQLIWGSSLIWHQRTPFEKWPCSPRAAWKDSFQLQTLVIFCCVNDLKGSAPRLNIMPGSHHSLMALSAGLKEALHVGSVHLLTNTTNHHVDRRTLAT